MAAPDVRRRSASVRINSVVDQRVATLDFDEGEPVSTLRASVPWRDRAAR